MSDNDYLAFSTDSPSPQSQRGGPGNRATYQPYPRPQRRWQQQPGQAGNRFFNHQQHSGGNRFHNQHHNSPGSDTSYGSSPAFGANSPGSGRQFHKQFHGRQNGRQQRSGFGFEPQPFQQRHFQNHSNGHFNPKHSNVESYYHPSMVEDPWGWFDEVANSTDNDDGRTDHIEIDEATGRDQSSSDSQSSSAECQ